MLVIENSDIKTNNKKRIIKLLAKERELTKLDISRKLEISVPTVTTIVGELIEEGIVLEAGMATSTGGRKPVIIRFLPNSRFSLGLELGKDYVRAVLTDLDSKIIEDKRKALDSINEKEVLSKMKYLIEEMLDNNTEIQGKLLGMGFSLPGTVNEAELKLEIATNFKLKNLCFRELQQYFNIPVYLENEANAGALGESNLGIAKDLTNLIYISITEGVGGGILINESMYKGKSSRAGEIGHMTIYKNGRPCNCGKKGCFETYASNRALINNYYEVTNIKASNIGEVIENFQSGDPLAMKVIETYIDDLAEGIGNLNFIFNPDYIVVGGEISKYAEIFQKKLTDKIFNNNEFYSEGDVDILFSTLGSDSNILGAALIPILKSFGFGKV